MSKSTTSTQKNEPPKWAEPLFKKSASEAMDLYKSGEGFNVYKGDRVADFTDQQNQAIGNLASLDNRALGQDYGTNMYKSLYNQAGGPSYAEKNLRDIAQGQSLYGDSRFQEMLDAQSAKIADQVNLGASAAGRYGSGMHTGSLADSIGDFRRNTVLQNYQNEVQRQLAANQQMDAGRMSGLAARQGLAGDIAGSYQNQFNNIAQGAQTALQAGTLRQQQQQAEMDAKRQAFTEKDMQDWTRLGALQAAATGSAGPYGMMTSTQTQPFNPLGIFGSIFGLSDRRLKHDVVKVGERNGFNWYEFAYNDEPGTRYRGVMADEVRTERPDAVVELDNGYLAVNYAALGLRMEVADRV